MSTSSVRRLRLRRPAIVRHQGSPTLEGGWSAKPQAAMQRDVLCLKARNPGVSTVTRASGPCESTRQISGVRPPTSLARAGGPCHGRASRQGKRDGFTLVELVAATALSALLLVVVLSVVRSIRPGVAAGPAADVAGPLARQLRWDLANAVVMRTDDRGLTLAGYGSLDPATLAATGTAAVVVYTLRPAGGRLWVVREQAGLGGRDDAGWSELVCGGVARLTVDAPPTAADLAAATRPADEDPTPLPFARLAGVRPVPRRARVSVTFAGGGTVDVEAFR